MAEIRSNSGIEDAAIKWVLDYEQSNGREAHDGRFRGEPTDVVSADRVIEVKAYGGSARGSDLWLEVRQFEEARRNPGFHLYIVENVRQGEPTKFRLIDLHGQSLTLLLDRAKEQCYYTVPFPVAVYDSLVQVSNNHRGTTG